MKKNFLTLTLGILMLASTVACSSNDVNLDFASNEKTIESGEAITIENNKKGVTYEIVNNPYENIISIDSKTGVITFNDSIPNYTQIMVIAKYKEETSSPIIVTLTYTFQESEVSFTNLSSYIVNGEYVNAISSKNYAVTYSLKNEITGISIESETGKINYSPAVKNNTEFTVVANSHGSTVEKEFIAMTDNFIESITSRQALERGNYNANAIYPLDFLNSDVNEANIVDVVNTLNIPIGTQYYTFDKDSATLTIDASFMDTLNDGENTFKVITERNSVEIRLDIVTKFINNASELASINDSIEALSGYYILMNDIDLSSYLSKDGEGYNEGKGWDPIGVYEDVLDATIATKYSFKGTFDGNGHVITNLYASRKDTASFNAGLFGYITSSATIKNLGVSGSLTVSSYSGGLVGSNSGIIENCWADVDMDVYSGEGAYRYVGGFAGNNFGTIKNCYSLGTVKCDKDYGCFVGSNEGKIENCFSYSQDNCTLFAGYGSKGSNCTLFENESAMKSFDYSNVYSSDSWTFTKGKCPTLKSTLEEYNIRSISLSISNSSIFAGESITLDVEVFPAKFNDQYKDLVTYEVIGEGCYISDNKVITNDANCDSITINATLVVDGITYSDSKIIKIKNKIQELTIEYDIEELVAGKQYLIEATFSPSDATDSITYYLSSTKYVGVTLNGNILSIDDECQLSSISLYAKSESGVKSNTVVLPIKKQNVVTSGTATIYEGENKNLEFTFDSSIDLTDVKVTIYGKSVDFTLEENKITVSKSRLEYIRDSKVRVLFELNDGTLYGADAYYFSHVRYNDDNLNDEELIKIYTVSDFFTYFNADPTSAYDSSKISNNYDKKYILMNDLDFNGQTLYSVGSGESCSFSGVFYGNGHTISNFKMTRNEKAFNDTSTDKYASYLYGVGLFGHVSGQIYDLNVSDSKITGNNFVGAVAGMVGNNGYLENCQGSNLTVTASSYSTSADGVYVGKIVGRNFSGATLCLYYNNVALNTVG